MAVVEILRRNQRRRVEAAMEEDIELKIKKMSNRKFLEDEPDVSDDSAIGSGSGSEENGGAEDGVEGCAEELKFSEAYIETNHEDLAIYKADPRPVNPQRLHLPSVREEVVGTFIHPAMVRFDAFSLVHGKIYQQRILDQIDLTQVDRNEMHRTCMFADNWIRFRLSQLSPMDATTTRIFMMYNHILNCNMTLQACSEVCLVTRYYARPDILAYMEMQLAYRYDPCYNTVKGTARLAYRPTHVF